MCSLSACIARPHTFPIFGRGMPDFAEFCKVCTLCRVMHASIASSYDWMHPGSFGDTGDAGDAGDNTKVLAVSSVSNGCKDDKMVCYRKPSKVVRVSMSPKRVRQAYRAAKCMLGTWEHWDNPGPSIWSNRPRLPCRRGWHCRKAFSRWRKLVHCSEGVELDPKSYGTPSAVYGILCILLELRLILWNLTNQFRLRRRHTSHVA